MTTSSQYRDRVRRLTSGGRFDAALIASPQGLRYFSGFSGFGGAYLVLGPSGSNMVVTELEAPDSDSAFFEDRLVVEKSKPLLPEVIKVLSSELGQGILGLEEEFVSLSLFEKLKGLGRDWVGISRDISAMRSVKDEQELSDIRHAIKISEQAFEQAKEFIRPGVTENQVAARLEMAMKEGGSEVPSFPTIVASGVRASNPHALPTGKKIGENEVVVVDFGATYHGYASDMTRTLFVGNPPKELHLAFDAVLETQLACFSSLRVGQPLSEAASLAVRSLEKYGLAKYYIHSLGHGIGLEVHESPYLSLTSNDVLSDGNTFTLEPGVYIPGLGGIRIEDDFLAWEGKVSKLSSLPSRL